MELAYSLSRADYISFQLFAASQSNEVKKTKRKFRVRLPIIYLIVGAGLLAYGAMIMAVAFFVIAGLWYFLSPMYIKKHFEKAYVKYVDEYFKNRFDTPVKISLSSEMIETEDFEGESKLKTSGIEKIVEIKRFFYLKMTSGIYLIIPKYKIENPDQLREELHSIGTMNNTDVETDLELDFARE